MCSIKLDSELAALTKFKLVKPKTIVNKITKLFRNSFFGAKIRLTSVMTIIHDVTVE